jgi:hypothetical protein
MKLMKMMVSVCRLAVLFLYLLFTPFCNLFFTIFCWANLLWRSYLAVFFCAADRRPIWNDKKESNGGGNDDRAGDAHGGERAAPDDGRDDARRGNDRRDDGRRGGDREDDRRGGGGGGGGRNNDRNYNRGGRGGDDRRDDRGGSGGGGGRRGGDRNERRGGGDGEDADERPRREIPTEPPYSLFVGSLDFDANEDDLRQLFSQDGEVLSVRLIVERDSGHSKGYGYVDFKTADGLKKALERDGQVLLKRQIKLDVATARTGGGGGGGGGRGGGRRGGGGDRNNSGM